MTEPAPRGPWVRILALYCAAAFIETIFWGQLNAFTPQHLPDLGVPPGSITMWTGITAAVAVAIGIPFLPLWGALADRYRRQPLIVRSFVVYLAAALVTASATNVYVYTLGRALMCFSLGNTGLMMTTLAETVPRERMAFAFSILNAGGPIGAFIGPVVGGPLVDTHGLPTLLLVDSAVLVVVIVALQLGYRDTYATGERRPILRMAADSVKNLWQSKVFALIPALFLLFTGWMLANTYVPLSVMSIYHGVKEGTAIGLVLGGGGLATLIIAPAMGAMADKLGMWRVMGVAVVLEVGLWLVPPVCPDIVTFAIAWAVVNGVASGVFSIAFTLLSESAPIESRGRVMAFAYLPVNLGALVGAGIGMGVGATTSVFAIFPATAAITACGVGALWVARRKVVA